MCGIELDTGADVCGRQLSGQIDNRKRRVNPAVPQVDDGDLLGHTLEAHPIASARDGLVGDHQLVIDLDRR